MAILKNPLKQEFSQIPNHIITDLEIDAPCFRLLCYLFSCTGNQKINNADICTKLGIRKRQTISNYWKVLIKKGYIVRTERDRTANGLFDGYDYELTIKCYTSR